MFSSRIARFSNVYHLSMHFPKNFGAETTKIFYIGLKGEWTEVSESRVWEGLGSCFFPVGSCFSLWNSAVPCGILLFPDFKRPVSTQAHRHEVTICNYEASANPADHKLEQITPQTHFIS